MAAKKAPKKSPSKAKGVKTKGELVRKPANLTLQMPLDAAKVKAIQKCIKKGRLTITVSKVDFAAGRIGQSWLYD